MSTTEAELVALAQCAIEMIYIISLLKFIGYECKGDVVVETDNKGAWELCAGESTDEVKQQRVAALSAWKTKRVFYTKPQQRGEASHLCLRGDKG